MTVSDLITRLNELDARRKELFGESIMGLEVEIPRTYDDQRGTDALASAELDVSQWRQGPVVLLDYA